MAKKNTTTATSKEWRLVHIICNGTTRLENDTEKTVNTASLTKAQVLIDFVYSKKPEDVVASKDFHVITIAKDLFARFIPKNVDEKHFQIEYKDLDEKLVLDLIVEIEATEAIDNSIKI